MGLLHLQPPHGSFGFVSSAPGRTSQFFCQERFQPVTLPLWHFRYCYSFRSSPFCIYYILCNRSNFVKAIYHFTVLNLYFFTLPAGGNYCTICAPNALQAATASASGASLHITPAPPTSSAPAFCMRASQSRIHSPSPQP